jgi:serine/threonine protein kinase
LAGLATLSPIGRIGRYDVLGRLAEGGMAEIFLARSAGAAGVARIVVVKRMLPSAEKNKDATGAFVTEARLLARLRHTSLVAIEEFGEEQGKHFLVMEWVRGIPMRRLFETAKAKGGVPWPIAARLFADLSAGLHHAHLAKDERGNAMKIVHRDVTPENIIVSWNGAPKLLDFGIAKSTIDPQKTQAGVLKGKLQYIAPEQYQGNVLDGRSDIFALGVSMYEALTGESLYARASEYETVAAIVLDPTVPSVRALRPDVPEELDAIVRGALAKDRDQRTASADAISAALEKLLVEKGQGVRDADVAAYLEKLFPGESARDPKLDRTAFGGPAVRRRTASKEMEAMLLGAEADIDADALAARQKSGGRSFIFVMLLVLVLVAGLFAWATLGAVEQSGPGATTSVPQPTGR